MKRLPFRRGVVLVLALAVLAALALWLGVFGQERAAADPGVDLVITKTASPSEASGVDNGDPITYTLTVTNTGDAATAGTVLIRDYIGTGLTFSSVTEGSGVAPCNTSDPTQIECTTDAAMDAGDSVTVTIEVTVSADSGYVYNGAYVDPEGDIPEDNDDADDPHFDCDAVGEGDDAGAATEPDNFDCTRHGVAMPDLTITKAASPLEATAVNTGDTITYTLTVSNSAAATGTATNVAIRDTIGSGLTLGTITPGSGVTCADTTPPEINCTAASIAPGESRTLTIAVTVSAASGSVLNGGYVDRRDSITEINEDDDDPGLDCAAVGEGLGQLPSTEPDNFDCTSHTVAALPDLTVTKTASPAETTAIKTGDTITYTVTASNSASATGTATNVAIRDTIGTGLTLSSVTPGTGVTCADTTAPEINCTATSIAPGESRTVTIVVTVAATSGSVLNGARVDPENAIPEVNDDADDPTLDCSAVGEGTDSGTATEPDNFDCTRHSFAEVSPTPTAGEMVNCPLAGKWAMSVWDGPNDTPTATALATCTGVTIPAAYALDRVSNTWSRYFPGRTDINTLLTLDDMQAIFTLGQ